MVAPGIYHVKARLVDLIGSSGIENATSAQPKNLASAPPFGFLGEWLGTRLVKLEKVGGTEIALSAHHYLSRFKVQKFAEVLFGRDHFQL